MGRHADEFERATKALVSDFLEDRIQERIDQLRDGGKVAPLKLPDADINHLLETLEMDEEINAAFDCGDGEISLEASRLLTTARRLVREAGYALPETAGGTS